MMVATAPRTALPFGDLGRSFKISLEAAGKSPETVRLYFAGLRAFAAFLETAGMPTEPEHISREHVESFLADVRGRRTAGTARAYYWGVRQFFALLLEEHEIRTSPVAHIKPPHVTVDPPQVLTDEGIRALLRVCEGQDFWARRDSALIRVLIDCGLRRTECGNLELEHVDWERRVVRVRGKGDRVRRVPFSRKTALALDRYLRVRRNHRHADSPYLWLGQRGPHFTGAGIYDMVKRRAAQAKIGKAWTHLFRHSWANDYMANGGQEGDAMRQGGWTNRAMLDRYGASAAENRAIDAGHRLARGDRF